MFKEMLSDGLGNISSKRSTMVWFVLLFTAIAVINITTGKKLDHDIQVELFQLVVISMGIVFGEPLIKLFALVRGQKTTDTTTIVAPKDATVVTTGTTKENPK